MKSKEIIDYLITLIEEYKNGIIDKEIVYERAETLVSYNKLEYTENEDLKYVLEHLLPDACLFYIYEPGCIEEKELGFYQAMCNAKNYLNMKVISSHPPTLLPF